MGFPTIDLMRTGANIVRLRKAAGLTVHDLQMVFGFNSPQAIYKWQNGAALPTVDNLIVLAALLHVRIDDILVTDMFLQRRSSVVRRLVGSTCPFRRSPSAVRN